MIEAVLFDIDGTLLDHDQASLRALHAGLDRERPGIAADERELAAGEWRQLEEMHYAEYLLGRIDLTTQRRRRVAGLLAHIGERERDHDELDRWFARFLADYRAAWTLFEDVKPTLEALGGSLRLGVITNADADLQRAKLEGVGIAGHLPGFTASSEAGVAKPEPEIFRIAARRLGLEPARVAYVGDRLETDARGAAAAGLGLGIWVNRARGVPAVDDVPTVRSLAELPALLDDHLA